MSVRGHHNGLSAADEMLEILCVVMTYLGIVE